MACKKSPGNLQSLNTQVVQVLVVHRFVEENWIGRQSTLRVERIYQSLDMERHSGYLGIRRGEESELSLPVPPYLLNGLPQCGVHNWPFHNTKGASAVIIATANCTALDTELKTIIRPSSGSE